MTDTRTVHFKLMKKAKEPSDKLKVYADGFLEEVITVKDTRNREAIYKDHFEKNYNRINNQS